LRTRWVGTHTHEVFFRDTAHGLVTWAVATVLVAILFAGATASGVTAAAAGGAGNTALSPEAMEAARRAAAQTAIYLSLSMLVGAFIASVSAAVGGRLRDEHP
jgi:hypothetical protein